MKPSYRAARALLVLLAAAAPARAAAQESEAWVLPRGLLELSTTGAYTGWDTRLDGVPLGAELFGPYQALANRLLSGSGDFARGEVTALFEDLPDPDSVTDLSDPISAGTVSLRFAGDVRNVPFTLRYGLSDRLTIFATVPLERSGTVVFGPYFAGATLGLNPDTLANRTALSRVDPRYAALGGGLLLPTRGSAAGIELQSRLRARNASDTLVLPTRPVNFEELLARPGLRALLTDQEAAALGIASTRRPYHLGDVQLGARFLLIRGPAGWPYPDSVVRRSLRTAVGVRARFPTGSGDTRLATELPPGSGHFGVGVDVLNDLFLSRRWYVNVAASGDWLLPADVSRQVFTAGQPFPVDSTLGTLRRSPGPRVSLSITPRWRLTDEISFSGEYALLAQARTRYEAEGDSLLPSIFEWRTGGAMHALGLGLRYSSLQSFARGRAKVPFELALTASQAVVGTVQAPDAFSVRFTARVFVDPRRVRALLPSRADTVIAPPDAPVDTLPSQVRPDSVPAEPPAVEAPPPATPPAPPPPPGQPPPAVRVPPARDD
ncbi:MAG TPA: hypothetical protein VHG93_24840 [Longimicrobium sp.]|nr:hypothetical protein [Longimicrobium sp.]